MSAALLTAAPREPHPVVAMLPPELERQLPPEKVEEFYGLRAEAIALAAENPLIHGYELEKWKLADRYMADFRKRYPIGVLTELDLGGNRAAKSERRAKRLVENMVQHPGWKAWACQATQTASRQNQQSIIYKYLPPEWKPESGKLRSGAVTKIVYTQAGGFTEDVLVCPNGSECRFKFYSMAVGSLEGAELDEGWGDELIPLDWIEALIFRLVTRNGTLGITFTPIEGYSPTVKAHLNGATTLLEAEAPLLPLRDATGEIIGHEKVPVVQENLRVEIEGQKSKALIFYFHTADNPFGNFDSMAATLEGASREKILTRAYGVPTKAALTRFPLFSDIVHVVSLNRFQEIQRAGGTWYHFLDPCSGRNWFQIWVFIDPLNRIFIRAESPSHGHAEAYIPGVGDPGPWAVAGNKADGNQGEGQKEWGWGYARYIEEMGRIESLLVAPGRDDSGKQESRKEEISKTEPMRLSTALAEAKAARAPEGPGRPEDKPLMRNPRGPDEARPIGHTASAALSPFLASLPRVPVYERWIDARYGNARRTQEESSTTLIDDLEAAGMRFLAAPSEHAIDSGRGGGDGSLRMINAALYYDKKRPVDHTNEPRLYVCESCPNVIYALKEWTGQDGQHGASKDPIDCLRMLVLSDVRYVNEALLAPKVPWLGMRR